MITSDKRVIAPVTPQEIYSLIGIGAKDGWWDIGYICSNQHGRINPWSRYKPVSLNTSAVNDTFKNATISWAESIYNGSDKWGENPWFFGSIYRKTFEVPVLSDLNEIGVDGIQNEDKKWEYNPPLGGSNSYYRLSDFLGYNHFANPPLVVNMSSTIKINQRFYAWISENDTSEMNGEFSFQEIIKFAFSGNPVYAGIAIWNKTRNILTGYVKESELGQEYDSGDFNLDPTNGNPIAQGGFSQILRNNEIVDIFLFLSYSKGDVDVGSTSKISAYLDKSCVCYKRFKVSYDYRIVTVPFEFTNLTHDIYTNVSYYVNDYDNDDGGDGTIYKITKYISAIWGNLKVTRTNNSDYRDFMILSEGTGTIQKEDGTTTQWPCCKSTVYFTMLSGNFNNADYRYILNGSEQLSFIGYRNREDAVFQRNGVNLVGIPIYDSVEYNGVDYESVGEITNRKVVLTCRGFSSLEYTQLTFKSSNDNNVIFEG